MREKKREQLWETLLNLGAVQRQLECYRRTMFYAMESGIQRDIHICVQEVWEQRKA